MRLDSRAALQCHELLHKLNAPSRFDLSGRIKDDPLPKALKEAGIKYEAEVLAFLVQSDLRIFKVQTGMGDSVRESETAVALLSTDIDVIIGASFGEHIESALRKLGHTDFVGDSQRVSRPDLLIRIESDSVTPQWAPVDIKSHSAIEENKTNLLKVTKLPAIDPELGEQVSGTLVKKDGRQLAHYVRHLQNLGFAPKTPWGGILGKDQSFIAWADLNALTYGTGEARMGALQQYDLTFMAALQVVEGAVSREANPQIAPVTIARRISGDFGCPTCEMRKVCRRELEDFDNRAGHVTLLTDITAEKAAKHFPDIESMADLLKADPNDLPPQGAIAQLRAHVWQTKKPQLINPSQKFEIPEFDIEIDIDLENSQEALREEGFEETLGRDSVYLYGYGIHDRTTSRDWRTAKFGYFDDYRDSDEAEFMVLSQMWQKLKEEVAAAEAAGKTVGIFHYSPHERTWWRNFIKRHGAKPGTPFIEEIENFMAKYFVDLYPIAQKVALPVTGYSIKVLAPLAGFEWEVKDAGGGNSIVYYQTATSPTKSDGEKAIAIKWLREYNRDDVKATFAAREYLRKLAEEFNAK